MTAATGEVRPPGRSPALLPREQLRTRQHVLPTDSRDLPQCHPRRCLWLQVPPGGSLLGGPQEQGERALSSQPDGGRTRSFGQRTKVGKGKAGDTLWSRFLE